MACYRRNIIYVYRLRRYILAISKWPGGNDETAIRPLSVALAKGLPGRELYQRTKETDR